MCQRGVALPAVGDFVETINGANLLERSADQPYQQALDILKHAARPISIDFITTNPDITALLDGRGNEDGDGADDDEMSPESQNALSRDEMDSLFNPLVADKDTVRVDSRGRLVKASEERFDLTFMGSLGFSLRSGREHGDLPVVSSSLPGDDTPNVGDKVEAVTGRMLAGHKDPWSTAIELLKEAGRPVTISFLRLPAFEDHNVFSNVLAADAHSSDDAKPSYDVVFHAEMKFGLLPGDAKGDLPFVSRQHPGLELPAVGHAIEFINGVPLAGQDDALDFAIELMKFLGRPLTITFVNTHAKKRKDRPSLPNYKSYDVTFSSPPFGFGLKAGTKPSDPPVVSFVPKGMSELSSGDWIEKVNGVSLQGSEDQLKKALRLIKSAAGDPVTLTFVHAEMPKSS